MTRVTIVERPFFDGMSPAHLDIVESVAATVAFPAGTTIFREGGEATQWYLITEGVVTLEIDVPGRGPHILQTLHEGDVLGWSWLFPPYRWSSDAFGRSSRSSRRSRSTASVSPREKCEDDPAARTTSSCAGSAQMHHAAS